MEDNFEEQNIVVIKENIFIKVSRSIRKLFFRKKQSNLLIGDGTDVAQNKIEFTFISSNTDYVQQEILDARRAFRRYVINNTKDLASNIFSEIENKIKEYEEDIKRLIEINNDDITYDFILDLIENEKNSLASFKAKYNSSDRYYVPIRCSWR